MPKIRGDKMAKLKNSKGITLTELLIVLAIAGLITLVALPSLGEWIRRSRIRAAADTLSVDCRAVRYIAVANRDSRDLNILVNPINSYNYTDSSGKIKNVELPVGVRLVSSTSNPITFTKTGSISGGAKSIVLECDVASSLKHQYTINISAIGKISVDLQQISP